jgi:pSer/pThr/pTyr-binding forkhead associated (FHA) protein
MPTAFLKALTPEAKACLGAPLFKIPCYPFRVGRESRVSNGSLFPNSRRRPDSSPGNDLYLADPGQLLNISREHFQIEQRSGAYFLVDRGSVCGTIVEGETIGKGRNGGEKQLENGDVIIVGTSESRQAFKFVTE